MTIQWCKDHDCKAEQCVWLHRLSLKGPERVVAEILHDLNDRRGLKHEWQHIDPDVQAEIFAVWTALVKKYS